MIHLNAANENHLMQKFLNLSNYYWLVKVIQENLIIVFGRHRYDIVRS